MVRMSSEELAIYEHKRTPPEIIKARQDKTNEQSERQLQEQMRALLGFRGIVYICSKFGKKSTIKPGWPDFTFAIKGRACAVEAKVGDNTLDPDQVLVMAQMDSNGWEVRTIRSLPELKTFLDEMEKL